MPKFILIDIRDDEDEDEAIERLLDELETEKDYEWDESMVNRHPAGTEEGGQFAPKDGASARSTEGVQGDRTRSHKVLEDAARNWIREKTGGKEPTRKDIADLAKHLGQEYETEINEAIAEFDDYGKYPERPAVHLVIGEKGVPDVWLLGWRENERGLEATPIHDHGPSEAGVYVHKGAVNERIFAINKAEIGQEQIEFRMVDRGLDQGGAITINAPYLHDIGAQKGAGTSVTIHAYYPPLNDMNFYEIRGTKLVKTGNWKESPEAMRKKGLFERSHVFPCFHYSTKKYHDPNIATHIAEFHADHDQETHGNWADDDDDTDRPFEEGGESTNPKDVMERWADEPPTKAELQKHLVDYKDTRPLTGPDTKAIPEIIKGSKTTTYMDAPGVDEMHKLMGIPQPSLDTDQNEYTAARDRLFKKQPLKEVPFSALTFTQPRVNVEELKKIPQEFQRKPVQIIKSRGGYYLMNGHHRVVGQYMDGLKSISGNVLDLDEPKFHSMGEPYRVYHYPGGEEHDQETHGNWATGESSDEKTSYADLRVLADDIEKELGFTKEADDIRARLRAGTQTRSLHRGDVKIGNGYYTPERAERHEQIIAGYLNGATPVDSPTITMMGGVSGSGKTYAREQQGLSNYVMMDADEIRRQLPEYQGWNAQLTQDEVDDISHELIYRAMSQRKNILLDSTMKSYNKFRKLVSVAKRIDYKVNLVYVDAPMEKAMRQVIGRYKQTGRYVDSHYVASQDHRNRETFAKLKAMADNWKLYDASGPQGVLREQKNG